MNLHDIHPIQRGILTKLLQNQSALHYGTLLPRSMKFQSDKFNYHLQFLVKEGLVDKSENGYKLTEFGLKVISLFTVKGEPTQMLKTSVAVIVVRKTNDGTKEILLQHRLRHPFYDDINSIAGKILPGEKIIDAAKRKLLEEAGLNADFTFVGILRKIRRKESGELYEDTIYHYCYADDPEGELQEINEHGENFWVSTEEALQLMKDNYDDGEEDRNVFSKLMKGDLHQFYIEQDRIIKGYTKD